ncbi:MAG: NAD-dependent epimerase/dehydratase family protein [Ichthyobacteriaceae bacterium]|nr:NAD-dependent epimerase/dehydratase family protein [Ichthyobacteriaceae bacterium]
MEDKVLVIGSSGQIGSELVLKLRDIYNPQNIIASDIRKGSDIITQGGPFEILDAKNKEDVYTIVKKHKITQVYLLAAMLSATAERHIEAGWSLNMRTLSNILDLGRDGLVKKIFWPSSIAVFGPNTPQILTPQHTIMDPNTVYGISKLSGERWCEYYSQKFNVDVRSIRYPGIISWKTEPGGGTTDYAIDIFYKALTEGKYTSFLNKTTTLPMLYMPDALKATIDIMQAPEKNILIKSSYNLAGISFNPEELAMEVKKHINDFTISYEPDFRQEIADSWPNSINDDNARKHWKWQHTYGIKEITADMLLNLKQKLKIK